MIADLRHQIVIEPEIMLHGKSACELLPCLEQMPDIGAGEIPAGRALTARLDRPRIITEVKLLY